MVSVTNERCESELGHSSHCVSTRTSFHQHLPLKILGKNWSKTSRLVASSKVLRNSIPTRNCDIIMTLPASTSDTTLMWILGRLRTRAPRLHVHVRHWKNTGVYAFYMTSDFENLLKGAEEFGVLKFLKSEYGSGHREFVYEEQHCFEGIEDEENFFTSQERQFIVYNMLLNFRAVKDETLGSVKFLEGQSIVPLLQSYKVISQVFPLHDTKTLKELRKTWVASFYRPQPLEKVCDYFGVKIAMYFAYLGHYTSALIVPTVLGVVFWFIQNENQVMEDLCFVTFALFNVLWATVYIELWLRRSSELAYKWGTLDKKGELLQEPRPLYTGYCTTSPVTGRVEPVYPSWKRQLFRYCVSLPVIGFCLFLVFYTMLLIFELQEWINNLVKREHIYSFCSYLPKVLLAVAIWIMDEIYKKIATWLNDKENYRMEETYENHLIIKLVLFQFVNSFLSLFYIAFYLQDMDRLRDQLATLLITRQVIGNLREALVPYLLWKAKLMKVGYEITGQMSPHTLEKEIKDLTKEIPVLETEQKQSQASSQQSKGIAEEISDYSKEFPGKCGENINIFRRQSIFQRNVSPLTLTQAEIESTMTKYEDTFDDHLEMFIQYGYVILFSSAFPLAAFCAFLNNLIEIRSDAFKLCFHQQRPFGKRVENIGTWLDALRVMGIVAVIVNSALIGLSGQASRMNPDLDTESTFILIVSLEHVILALKACIAYAIPSRPEWIDTEMARWEFRRREALKSVDASPLDLKTNLFYSTSQSPSPYCDSPRIPVVPARKNASNLGSLKRNEDAEDVHKTNPLYSSVIAEYSKAEYEGTVEGQDNSNRDIEDKNGQTEGIKDHTAYKKYVEASEIFHKPADLIKNTESDVMPSDDKREKTKLSVKDITTLELEMESSSAEQFEEFCIEKSWSSNSRLPTIDRWYTSTADYEARKETKRKILQAARNRQLAGLDGLKSKKVTDL